MKIGGNLALLGGRGLTSFCAKTARLSQHRKSRNTIRAGNGNVSGAELWVNGVYLGKTPVTTTVDDFLTSAPFWKALRMKSGEMRLEHMILITLILCGYCILLTPARSAPA